MIANLQELVAPLTEDEFVVRMRARKITFQPSSGVHRFRGLLDWDALHALITNVKIPPNNLRVYMRMQQIPPIFYSQNDKVNPAMLARLFEQGASLVVGHLPPHLPALETICQAIKLRVGETIWPGAIVSTGTGLAIELHYDSYDLIILQVEGTKRWRIYGSPVCNPVRGMLKPQPPSGEPIFNEILQPGDFLFVPAGYWHQCETGPGRSLHLSIFFAPPTGWHAVPALTSELLADEIFRVPLTRLGDAEQLSAHEVMLKRRLIEKIERLSLTEFLAANGTAEPTASELGNRQSAN
jgi:hypothetical protein